MRPSTSPPRHLFALLACLVLLCLVASGCGHVPRMLGGSTNLDLRLDGEQKHQAELPVGSTLALDMRDPGASGYVFAGTSFDTRLLRLDGIEPAEGGRRYRYTFTALAEGQCDIIIHIRKAEPGYRPDVFKFVQVNITK